MEPNSELEPMLYGFRWDQVEIERLLSINGYRVIGIRTPRQYMEITITPTGLIRCGEVFRRKPK